MRFKTYSFVPVIVFGILGVFLCNAQNENANSKWDLAFKGITLTDDKTVFIRENRIQGFESSMIELPVLLKININEKLSALAGTKLDFFINSQGFSTNIGINTSFGLQYNPSANSYIQGVFNYQINNVNNVYQYNYGSKSSFMLNTGIKF